MFYTSPAQIPYPVVIPNGAAINKYVSHFDFYN